MQQIKPMQFGCVILCPDRNAKNLKNTTRSIANYTKVPCIAVVPKECLESAILDMKDCCNVYRGGNTYTSLINIGLSRIKTNWIFILFAGTIVRPNFWKRYMMFMESEKDIIFPITAGHYNFIDGSLNGLFLHKTAIKNIGKMPEISNIEESKTAWGYNAITCGYKLKGLLGTKFC